MSAQQLARNVGRRIPLIKFKYGKERANNSGGHSLTSETTTSRPATTNNSRSVSSSSSSLEFFQLPKKYQRKPITVDEMETINKGGF